ncbi:Innate immunity activator protein [Triplophysa tibetana]|uniref:Innate immunity activator protein n=1 Tax=Triplophysa tibetana TaxID=1572043 RepID=A0A5A9NEA8_9TELE|nr:Innate immunity activator protein [Triplophysa tibetana]
MEGKEEISDTDSGVILHSGPDSPTTVIKDVTHHTRVMKLKQQSLEDRLKLCLLELKKLCIREAEITGHLSSDYQLLPGEKPPQIRRRIGAAFKLDEPSFLQRPEDSELSSVEAGLALQQQIYLAAQRLCQEEHRSKGVKRSRQQQYLREEKKLKDLQEALFRLQLERSRSSPRPGMIAQKGTSDDSSLSDSAVLDEEELASQCSQHYSELPAPAVDPHPPPLSSFHSTPYIPTTPSYRPPEVIIHQTPPQSLENLHLCHSPTVDYDPAPIQNSPWTESSLDRPYQKQKRSHSSSTKSSPAVTPTLPPLEVCHVDAGIPLQISTHTALRQTQSCSAPSTPEMHLRRGQSLRVPNTDPPYYLDRERGRSRGPRRRLTEFAVTSQDYSPMRSNVGNPMYCSSSEDSNSEYSVQSYASSPCHEHPCELLLPYQPQYAYQYGSLTDNHVSQRYSPISFNKNYQHLSSPSFARGYVEDRWGHPLDMDTGRSYMSHPAPSPVYSNGHYEYFYNESPQRSCRVLPAHVRLSRAPSLRECPHHPTRGLPRQVVSEELKSWHQRSQQYSPRPSSLERSRQGALHIRNAPGHESPLTLPQHRMFQEQQVSQKRVIVMNQDMMYEDDSEIASEV